MFIGVEVIAEGKKKIKHLKKSKSFSVRPVLIHVNGVTENCLECDFFLLEL